MGYSSQTYQGVALVAPTTISYERYSEHGAAWFIGKVLAGMLKHSGLKKSDIDGLAVASFTLAPDSVVALNEYFSMTTRWIEHLSMGGASGVIAMRRAARAVQAGDAEVVACIAGDTCNTGSFRDLVENFSNFSKDAVYPYGACGPNAVFAMITRNYMERYGVEREDFGRICISQRENALKYASGLFKKPLSMREYLNARPIAEPLHLFDCVMPCAGGEGFLVMSTERAKSLHLPHSIILGAGEIHNAFFKEPVHINGGWRCYRDELYDMAACGPEDIDFLQTYDDYPVITMLQMEDLGFCEKGQAAEFVHNTPLTYNGGGLPHNSSGGQLSVGQAGAAGGFLGLVEAIRQLTTENLANKVPNAKTGLVSGYGMVNYDRCLCTSAAILAKAGQ